jgi:hypothetical protein
LKIIVGGNVKYEYEKYLRKDSKRVGYTGGYCRRQHDMGAYLLS